MPKKLDAKAPPIEQLREEARAAKIPPFVPFAGGVIGGGFFIQWLPPEGD